MPFDGQRIEPYRVEQTISALTNTTDVALNLRSVIRHTCYTGHIIINLSLVINLFKFNLRDSMWSVRVTKWKQFAPLFPHQLINKYSTNFQIDRVQHWFGCPIKVSNKKCFWNVLCVCHTTRPRRSLFNIIVHKNVHLKYLLFTR